MASSGGRVGKLGAGLLQQHSINQQQADQWAIAMGITNWCQSKGARAMTFASLTRSLLYIHKLFLLMKDANRLIANLSDIMDSGDSGPVQNNDFVLPWM
jgi:hypothetical protein